MHTDLLKTIGAKLHALRSNHGRNIAALKKLEGASVQSYRQRISKHSPTRAKPEQDKETSVTTRERVVISGHHATKDMLDTQRDLFRIEDALTVCGINPDAVVQEHLAQMERARAAQEAQAAMVAAQATGKAARKAA